MNIENLQPVAGDHAVQSVHFVVEWGGPLPTDSILALGKLNSKFRNLGYGNVLPQNRVQLKLDGSGPTTTTHGVSGYIFTQHPQPEVGRQIGVNAENCTIMFPDYTRWDNVFNDVQEVVKLILDEVGTQRPIRTIGLQYNDAFLWNDDPEELNLQEVFKSDFVIPPHVFSLAGLWHLHHGFFEKFAAPLPHVVLQNINVDMVDSNAGRVLQIVGSHKATLNELLWQPHKKNKAEFLAMFGHLHELNKVMLRKLLMENICKRIKLDS